jgi:proline racemase
MTKFRSMSESPSIELILVHCQGEIGKVIVDGAPDILGRTQLEKMNYINEVDDSFRRFVTSEPRACVQMSVNLLTKPCRPDADAGFIVLQSDRAHPMSGSNCICVVTALLETGRVAMTEPETVVRLDTPAGLITARAVCIDGRCVSVSLENVPSFAVSLGTALRTDRWGELRYDVAFGGVFYAIIDVDQLGLEIRPELARDLAEAGIMLKGLLKSEVRLAHPDLPSVNEIAYVMFRDREADGAVRTCTTLMPGRVDRSPCGTGSSANLALLYARGEVNVGDARRSRSIIGGEFLAEVVKETRVGEIIAIVPRITGQAWIYGSERLRLDGRDPFPSGFALSDTWGPLIQTVE